MHDSKAAKTAGIYEELSSIRTVDTPCAGDVLRKMDRARTPESRVRV